MEKTIHYKKDLDEVLAKCNGEELAVVIDRNGEEKSYTFAPKRRKNITIQELQYLVKMEQVQKLQLFRQKSSKRTRTRSK